MLQYGEGSYGNVFDGWFDDECRGRDNDPIGKDIETPQHLVKVGVFYLSKMDVTRGEFAVFARKQDYLARGAELLSTGGGSSIIRQVGKIQAFLKLRRTP